MDMHADRPSMPIYGKGMFPRIAFTEFFTVSVDSSEKYLIDMYM